MNERDKGDQGCSFLVGGILYFLNEDPVMQRFKKIVFYKQERSRCVKCRNLKKAIVAGLPGVGGNEVRGHIEARKLKPLELYSELSMSQNIKIRLLLP